MTHHVRGRDAFGGVLVVGATGGVDVVVAGKPLTLGGVDPALELEVRALAGDAFLDGQLVGLDEVFRAAGDGDGILAGREEQGLAICAIDLVVEEEIGGQAAGWIRIDPTMGIADDESGGGGPAVHVLDAEGDADGGDAVEQDGDLVAEAEVLGALANIEGEGGLAAADVAAVELDDAIFRFESGKAGLEGAVVEHGDVEEAMGDIGGGDLQLGLG